MARLNLRTFSNDGKLKYNVFVIGKRMPNSFMKAHYGERWMDEYVALYQCHKNPYGIEWAIIQPSRYGGLRYDIATSGKGERVINYALGDRLFIEIG